MTLRERVGVVVEHRTTIGEVLGSIPTDGTELCPSARHINPYSTG